MNEELKTELDKTLATLAKRVDSCREAVTNGDKIMYKHYVNEIRYWANSVLDDLFDNFYLIAKNEA